MTRTQETPASGSSMRRSSTSRLPITAALAVWPGDTPLRREVLLDMDRGDSITLSDAPRDGPPRGARRRAQSLRRVRRGIEARPLEDFLGPCQVIRVTVPPGRGIGPEDLGVEITEERVLLRTGTLSRSRSVQRRLRRAGPRAGRSPARARRPARRHRHAQRRPVRLHGPAGSSPLPRARHGHPRGPRARGCSPRAATS